MDSKKVIKTSKEPEITVPPAGVSTFDRSSQLAAARLRAFEVKKERSEAKKLLKESEIENKVLKLKKVQIENEVLKRELLGGHHVAAPAVQVPPAPVPQAMGEKVVETQATEKTEVVSEKTEGSENDKGAATELVSTGLNPPPKNPDTTTPVKTDAEDPDDGMEYMDTMTYLAERVDTLHAMLYDELEYKKRKRTEKEAKSQEEKKHMLRVQKDPVLQQYRFANSNKGEAVYKAMFGL